MTTIPQACAIGRGKHDKEQRRQAFIDAATHVFAQKGYECATTREIAERAGCSEGLIHRYFGGKRGLLLAILHAKTQDVRRVLHDGAPDSDDLLVEVEELLTSSLDHAWENRDFMRVSVAQAIVDPGVGRFVGAALNKQRVAVFQEKLLRHQQAARIDAAVDLDALAEGLSGIAFSTGFFLQVVFERDREEVRRLVAGFAKIIARGIAPRTWDGRR